MLAQITNSTVAINSIAQGIQYYLPNVSLVDIVAALLGLSKIAQVAYKHWTTPGTKMDSAMKLLGVVQEPTATTIVDNTLAKPVNK